MCPDKEQMKVLIFIRLLDPDLDNNEVLVLLSMVSLFFVEQQFIGILLLGLSTKSIFY